MFGGVIPALVTPLTPDGQVSDVDVARLVDAVRPHVQALVPTLSTGEGAALSGAQWRDMVASTLAHAEGLPVLVGVLCPTTDRVVARAREAAGIGADAVVVTTPYGSAVTQKQMYRHYATVTREAGVPVVVYHETERSGNHIEFDTVMDICALDGVVAVKDSTGSAAATRRLVEARPGVAVLQGWEHLLAERTGVDGCVVALANLEPDLCAAVLREPTDERAAAVRDACRRYGLDRPDWYRCVKRHLFRRGTITSDTTIEEENA